jgi:2-polyprenyl-3-methyl-5-hydroxy-6-metoxy-1,4-benzoquinol methylase
MTGQRICPICGSASVSFHYSAGPVRSAWQDGGKWDAFECSDCKHVFISPQPDEAELNGYYARSYSAYDTDHGTRDPLETLVAQATESKIYRHVRIEPGMRLLDVGCGGGSFLAVCQKLGAEVMGVEPSEIGVESCRKNDVPVFHGTLTDFLSETDETYDLIAANHVVEHHPDPVLLLSEMRSALRPDGTVWISIPNAGCYFSRALKGAWHSADLPVHLHHFSTSSASRLFEQAGLQVQGLRTESQNSLISSFAMLLRRRVCIPRRVTTALFKTAMSKDGWLGQRIDASGNGEAILMSGKAI